ncbi:MAG: helix-turn-helix transcriptional regulator, partial [Candidatus Omnitrophica bacterium]|nr:helix-turn-helix transcriptional regulator [Candidatus Omnitrophota bacterium]
KIGVLVKDARIKKGLSQSQLALRVGMKQPDISQVEEGRKNITLYTLMRLCKVLEIERVEMGQIG